MKNIKYEKEFFTSLVRNSNNLSDIARKLNLSTLSGNRSSIKKYIALYDVDISHFKTDYSTRTIKKIPIHEILVSESTYCTNNLKKRLYSEGFKEHTCELCGQDEIWNGRKMSLILDHINGINNDHRIENLRIVCPNCDATLPTYCGKNISKIKKIIKDSYKYNYCSCGKKINKQSLHCKKCSSILLRKVERPEYDILIDDVNKFGYRNTGKKYGVSDNTIKNWLKLT